MLQKSYSLSGELPVSYYIEENRLSDIDPERLLARICFADAPSTQKLDTRIYTGLKQLPGQPELEEIWVSKDTVVRGVDEGIVWGTDDNFLFASHYLDENAQSNLEEATFACYQKLLSLMKKFDYQNLVRMWNYVPKINQTEEDLERYKHFSVGRYKAFQEAGIVDGNYSSACAVGSDGTQGVVYLLASRHPCEHFENPNQISAYNYPQEYGPRSPSFARATLATSPVNNNFFISGTASITQSESRHQGNLNKQLELTFENIQTLIDVVDSHTKFKQQPGAAILKTYIRRPEDVEIVKNAVEKHFGSDPQVIYVRGDICRKDLLVEIDGIWTM